MSAAAGYPFQASERIIKFRPQRGFNEYLFLLIGCALRYENGAKADRLKRRFRKYFEDLLCWALRTNGYTAYVLSEPRRERGLHRSLKPALKTIGRRFDEQGTLREDQITDDDNDLGVDVVATLESIDVARSGRPVFLFQCATGPPSALETKITEKQRIFCEAWHRSFYYVASIRGGATPNDLLKLEPVFWDRLCQHGWIIDRMRLVRLVRASRSRQVRIPSGVTKLWDDLLDFVNDIDWRNGWRAEL